MNDIGADAGGGGLDCLFMQALQQHFSKLRQRLLASELDDFGMSKDADWSIHSSEVTLRHLAPLLVAHLTASQAPDILNDSADVHWHWLVDTWDTWVHALQQACIMRGHMSAPGIHSVGS